MPGKAKPKKTAKKTTMTKRRSKSGKRQTDMTYKSDGKKRSRRTYK